MTEQSNNENIRATKGYFDSWQSYQQEVNTDFHELYHNCGATLDREIRTALAAIPPDRRKIVTTHDAFGYFSRAYGVEMMAPQGVSTESEPSAKDVARIIRQVKADHIPAVFLENISDPRLAQRIASESGAKMGGKLYSDALSREKEPAGTYIAMMKANIRELTKALMP